MGIIRLSAQRSWKEFLMLISQRSVRNAAAGAVGAAAVTGAMLFGGDAVAQAAPAPTQGTSFAAFGPHGGPGGPGIVPERPGGGWGHGGGHGGGWGRGHGGWGHGGGMGRGGGWGHGGWGRGVGRGWGRGGDRSGFSHRGIFGNREAWNWWW
jgi:hypothetical protein